MHYPGGFQIFLNVRKDRMNIFGGSFELANIILGISTEGVHFPGGGMFLTERPKQKS